MGFLGKMSLLCGPKSRTAVDFCGTIARAGFMIGTLAAGISSPACADQEEGKITATDAAQIAAMQNSEARFDAIFSRKGINTRSPSYADSILGDYDGVRTALAQDGVGIIWDNVFMAAYNVLDVPRRGPGPRLASGNISDQQYWGQKPSLWGNSGIFLLYDASRLGVPDGQIVVAGMLARSSWEPQLPEQITLFALSWYQTLFDKAVELKLGYVASNDEWIGMSIGGSFASTLGGSAAIPYEMGLSAAHVQPSARVTWHITDRLYEQFGAMRSQPIGGPTGSPITDSVVYNPTGFDFAVPNGKLLLMNELGYKREATPGSASVWVRGGWMYNESNFVDYKHGGANSGVSAGYFVADLQLMQFAPDSIFTAHRGIYIGGTAMYGTAEHLPFSEYYEARLYIMGPFASRPADQLVLDYSFNGVSKYLRNAVNMHAPMTGPFAARESASYLISYTARLSPGVYATAGLSYTDNPSLIYTRDEGHALNALLNLYLHM